MSIYIILLLFIFQIMYCECFNPCDRGDKNKTSEYYLVAPCYRSTLKIIASINHVTLEDCKILANKKNGMAINYSSSPITFSNITENDIVLKTCMVLSCPEIENSTSLIADFRYNYYSMYANPIPPTNSSCVEGVGVFVYHLLKSNYTNARQTCQDLGAKLADVVAESRTNLLTQHLTFLTREHNIRQVYVGLDDIEIEGRFERSNGDLLACSKFRAWAPGHPKQKNERYDCVLLDVNRMWKTVVCDKTYPFLCEIIPNSLNYYYDYFEPQSCVDDVDIFY